MKILVLGSGGREHALVWKIGQNPLVKELYCVPGNPGIARHATCVPFKLNDHVSLLDFARSKGIDLTVVGPEQPLAEGIVDLFTSNRMTIFGPTKRAAELEWSKVFAKEFMTRHRIPTAAHRVFQRDDLREAEDYVGQTNLPVVLKADGLAAGKGVLVCRTKEEARAGLQSVLKHGLFGAAGDRVIVEEFMMGEEASVFAICDGRSYVTLAPAQDYKRVFDDDRGKNTGGMGSYAPAPVITPEVLGSIRALIIEPTLRGMEMEGRPYTGCLYIGLMVTSLGPRVVEFNCRFGDPETQVVLPLMKDDLPELLMASATGSLSESKISHPDIEPSAAAVCVILASKGYPDAYDTGKEIRGLGLVEAMKDVIVFHAGTSWRGDSLCTAGGRVLGVTSCLLSGSLEEARARAYEAVNKISFEGMHYRKDIARNISRTNLVVM
jgi:phosphoribosylamine--glycine ligase